MVYFMERCKRAAVREWWAWRPLNGEHMAGVER